MSDEKKYDLTSPAFKANPYPTYAKMRQEVPIYKHELPLHLGGSTWFVTRYDYVEAILHDHKRFVKNFRLNAATPEQQAKLPPTPHLLKLVGDHMLNHDAPIHSRLRNLVSKAFTPPMINKLRPMVEEISRNLLDKIQNKKEMDLISEYAYPFVLPVTMQLIGLPLDDIDKIRVWADAFSAPVNTKKEMEAYSTSMKGFTDYLNQIFDKRRKNPQQDLVTELVHAKDKKNLLSETELSSMVFFLLLAGYDTSVHIFGTGMLSLLQHPGQLKKLKNDLSMIEVAIEELLRYAPSLETATLRYAAEDVQMDGQTIRKGERVMAIICSANRDSESFCNPDSLDICRDPNQHQTFGYGIHFCLGAPLARLEAKVGFKELLERLPGIRLNISPEELSWRVRFPVRGLVSLPIAWD